MALTGLYSINGSTSALEDKGLRDFISTASGSWTGGGGEFPTTADNACKEVTAHSGNWNGVYTTVSNNSASWTGGGGSSGPVTSTGGTTTYINKLNNKNLSASVAYASPNGAVLDNVYNSGRSGYAASAYLVNNVTGNVGNWNASRNYVTSNSANIVTVSTHYDSYNNPNFWQYTANNIYGFKINSANFSQLTVQNARIGAYKDAGGLRWFDIYFWFSKFIPKTATSTYTVVQNGFMHFGNLHIISPFTSLVENVWGSHFGCIGCNNTWGTDSDLYVWSPWTGYTGQDMVVTAHIHIA